MGIVGARATAWLNSACRFPHIWLGENRKLPGQPFPPSTGDGPEWPAGKSFRLPLTCPTVIYGGQSTIGALAGRVHLYGALELLAASSYRRD